MPVIQDVGRFLDADADGWLVNPAVASTLQPDWRSALDRMVSACRTEVGDRYCSFYVRGSVACGRAVRGSSDLDTVLVVDDEEGERRPAWQHPLGARIITESPFITDVEVVVVGRGALLEAAADPAVAEPVMAQWCFLMGVGARCLDGVDLLSDLGRFRSGPNIAYVLKGLPPDMLRFEERLTKARASRPSPANDAALRRLCAWTCKKLLRSGAELLMLTEGRFTRDLGPCAAQMGKRLPEFADTAQRLLRWAIDPPADLSELEQVVRELEPVLAGEARAAGLTLQPRR